LSFKFVPGVKEAVPGEDRLKARGIQRPGLDELKQARFVLGAPGLESYGGEVLDGKNTRRRSVNAT